ncbi:hypothetical protein KJ575_05065 [Patescibacteria group bacterium]|nr:hypothetical protein [Patescibacteria group bacterium]
METKFKILLGVFVLLFGVWLGISAYNKYWKNSGVNLPAVNPPATGQLPRNNSKNEEARIKSLAEDFVRVYGSYRLGDFSGLENLREKMTFRLWVEKSEWIKTKKEEFNNQPKRYITFFAFVKKSDILSFINGKVAEAEVEYLQTETRGAIIQGEITIKYVNEFGEEKPIPPPTETSKKIRLKIVKENEEWKVDEIIPTE